MQSRSGSICDGFGNSDNLRQRLTNGSQKGIKGGLEARLFADRIRVLHSSTHAGGNRISGKRGGMGMTA